MKKGSREEEYAPVCIPTLNRYTHFKACLESLMKCTHADKTEVYVALDHPSKESHWEGYHLIKSYLESISDHHGFKGLYVIERKVNYGLGSKGNFASLREYIFSKYTRAIFSEDDNVFSPAFLDYCNKGLDKFANDKSVFAISGYSFDRKYLINNNTYIKQNVGFSAWGYATWKDRDTFRESLSPKWFRQRLTLRNWLKHRKDYGNNRALDWICFCVQADNEFLVNDNSISIYSQLSNKYFVMPTLSLVRNIGVDGSGAHFKDSNKELQSKMINQVINDDSYFDFKGTGEEYYTHNRKLIKNYSYAKISIFRLFMSLIKIGIRQIINKYR